MTPEQATDTRAHARFTFIVESILSGPQILATVIVLALHWADRPQCNKPLREWALLSALRMTAIVVVSGAIHWGGFAVLPQASEQQRSPIRFNVGHALHRSKHLLDIMGLAWFVIGNMWVFRPSNCPDISPAVYNLCLTMVLITHGVIFLPCIIVMLLLPILCFCLPCVIRVLSRARDPMQGKGATDALIDSIETIEYDESQVGSDASEKCCSICLADYENKELLRRLPCQHHFHKECVDSWLRVNATCPNCRQPIEAVHSQQHPHQSPARDNEAEEVSISLNPLQEHETNAPGHVLVEQI